MDPPPDRFAMRAPLATLAALCALLCVGVYGVAFGSDRARAFDEAAVGTHGGPSGLPDVQAGSAAAVDTIDLGSLVLLGGGIVGVALVRRRRDLAAGVAALLVGANGTAQALKPLLERADPLGGDALRTVHGSFPSGHATVAMSIALAVVLAAPAALKSPATLVGAAYAAAVGVSLLVQGWHYPSDVAGGYLVAGAWAAAVAALLPRRRTTRRAAPESLWRGAAVAILLVFAFLVFAGGEVARHPELRVHAALHRQLALSAVALSVLALAVCGAFSAVLQARAVRR